MKFNPHEKREIPGFEGLYAADIDGNIWSLVQNSSRRRKKLKPYINAGGYRRVNLYDTNGKVHKEYVHRLVAKTFLPNPNNWPEINHISANKADNSVSNIEWCEHDYNIAESHRMGLQKEKCVSAFSLITGEVKWFESIKEAAITLAGKKWAFSYLRQRKGNDFFYREWRIEVMPRDVQGARLSKICD